MNSEGKITIPVAYNEIGDFFRGNAIARINGNFGIIQREGKILTKFNWDYIYPYSDGFALAKYHNGTYTYLNEQGKQLKKKYEDAKPFSAGFAAVKENGKWGFIDKSGKWLIEPNYKMVESFQNGLALAQKPSNDDKNDKETPKYGYLSADGNWLIPPKFEEAYSFSEGFAAVKENGKWGYISISGSPFIEFNYDNALPFLDEQGWVKYGDDWQAIDKFGNRYLQVASASDIFIDMDEIPFMWTENETNQKMGLHVDNENVMPFAYDRISSTVGRNRIFLERNKTWNYLNSKNEIIEYNFDDVDYMLMANNAIMKRIKKEGKYGFFNTKTETIVIPMEYDNAESFFYIYPQSSSFGEDVQPLAGYAKVERNGKWGIIDMEGKMLVPVIYDQIDNFSEGYAKVTLNGKNGYVSTDAKVILPIEFEQAGNFKNGQAEVKKNGKWGMINHKGEEIIPIKYDQIRFTNNENIIIIAEKTNEGLQYGFLDLRTSGDQKINLNRYSSVSSVFISGLLEVAANGKKGFINENGEEVISTEYDDVGTTEEEPIAVRKGEKWGYVDKTGKIIIPFIYDSAEGFGTTGQALVEKDGEKYYINKTGRKEAQKNELDLFDENNGDW